MASPDTKASTSASLGKAGKEPAKPVDPIPDPRLKATHPEYDSRYDPTSPSYDPNAPKRAPYDPRNKSTHKDYDPKYDPQSPKYDPSAPPREPPYDPRADPAEDLYDPRYDPESDKYDPKTKPEKAEKPEEIAGAETQYKVTRDFEWSDTFFTVRGVKGQTVSGAGMAKMHEALGDESPLEPAEGGGKKKEEPKKEESRW